MSSKGFGYNALNQKITQVADGVAPTDAINKGQLDNAVDGRAWKQPVRVASTTNGTLASAYANGSSVDGVTLTTGMRILLKDQTTGTENGIYVVNVSGAPTRATDGDTTAELQNATVYVIAGSVNSDKAFTQTANDPVIGTTALVFAQVGGGTVYSAGNGLSLSGSTFAVVPGAGILSDGTSTRVDPAYSGLAKRYASDFPATASGTTITFTHNLGTVDVIVAVKDLTDNSYVDTNFLPATSNTVTGSLPVAITTGQYRIVILG